MNLRELLNLKWASMLMDEQRKSENEDKFEIQTAYFSRKSISDDEIKTLLGRKWRTLVGQMSSLAKWCIKRPNPNYFELNTKRGEFATIGSRSTVSRLVAKAEQLEMITCIDKTYHFGSDKATKNYGKKYAVNVPVARDVINFYNSQFISPVNNSDNRTVNGNGIINDSDCDNCLISVQIRDKDELHYHSVQIRDNAPYKIRGTYNDSDLTNIEAAVEDLYTRYPFILDYQAKTALRNETYYKDVEMMQQRMTPTYNTRKQSVGFRCFSGACRTKKGIQRELEVFQPYLGTRHPYEYDVKASIYNVTKAINTGIWTGDDDIYRLIAGEELDDNQRKALKAIVQQLYFEANPNRHAANVASKLYGRRAGIVEEIKPLTTMLFENMQNLIGKIWGSEIFIIESCLYADVLDRLLAEGFKIVQVYDCFYSDDSRLGDKVRHYLPICLDKFLKKLMNENNATTNTDNDLDDLEAYLSNMSWRDIENLGAPSQPRSRYGADTLTYKDCEEALGLTSEIHEDAVETPCEDVMEKNTTESVERPQEATERETEAVLEDNVEPVVEQVEVKPVETVKDDDETIDDVLNQIAKDYDLAHAGQKTTPVKAMDDDALDALIEQIGLEGGVQKYKDAWRSHGTKWTKIDISRHDAPQRGQHQQYKKALVFALNH